MANSFYNPFKQALLDNGTAVNLSSGNDSVKAALIDAGGYTFSASHVTYTTDVSGGKIAISSALGSPTVTSGVFDTADFTWSAVTGNQSENIIIEDDTVDLLIAFYDTGITGMPVTPNGGDINVTVNASGWFSL